MVADTNLIHSLEFLLVWELCCSTRERESILSDSQLHTVPFVLFVQTENTAVNCESDIELLFRPPYIFPPLNVWFYSSRISQRFSSIAACMQHTQPDDYNYIQRDMFLAIRLSGLVTSGELKIHFSDQIREWERSLSGRGKNRWQKVNILISSRSAMCEMWMKSDGQDRRTPDEWIPHREQASTHSDSLPHVLFSCMMTTSLTLSILLPSPSTQCPRKNQTGKKFKFQSHPAQSEWVYVFFF